MLQFIHSPWVKVFLVFLLVLFFLALYFSNDVIDFAFKYLLLYRYTTIFIVVFLAGFCIPIPMNILLMAIGALTIDGTFNFYIALVTSMVANLLGDLAAVYIFRRWGHRMLHDQFAEQYSFFVRLEQFFIRHANISIYVSRIIGAFGTPVNFLSGYLKIPYSKFTLYDILGNLTYVCIFLGLGYWAGDKWVRVGDFVSAALSVVAVLLFISILFLLFKTSKPKSLTLGH